MLRLFVAVLLVTGSLASAAVYAQTAPTQSSATTTKPAKKLAKKPKAAELAVEAGPCGMGVITTAGDVFTVQKIGLTVFGNEYNEVPISWGLDDLIFARVKAAGGAGVRRIAYPKGAFDSYYKPSATLFGNKRQELIDLVRQIAGSTACDRYLVVTRSSVQFNGTNQTLTGIGVLNQGTSLFNRSYAFAYIGLQLFDGHTFEIRGNQNANFNRVLANIAADISKTHDMVEIDNTAYPASPPDVINNAMLREKAQQLIVERLDKDMPAYFGTPAQ